MKRWIKLFAAVFAAAVLSGTVFFAAFAESEDEHGDAFSYGTISNVSSGAITVQEYNYETDEELEAVYVVGPETEFKNANSLQDISAGVNVDIIFDVVDGKKNAKSISVEEPASDEESVKPSPRETENLGG